MKLETKRPALATASLAGAFCHPRPRLWLSLGPFGTIMKHFAVCFLTLQFISIHPIHASDSNVAPFRASVVAAPQTIPNWGHYFFNLEIMNPTISPINVCIYPGFDSETECYRANQESASVTRKFHFRRKMRILAKIDEATGKISEKFAEGPEYDKEDFITLKPNEKRKFAVKVNLDMPDTNIVQCEIRFFLRSAFNGKSIKLDSWKGEMEVAALQYSVDPKPSSPNEALHLISEAPTINDR